VCGKKQRLRERGTRLEQIDRSDKNSVKKNTGFLFCPVDGGTFLWNIVKLIVK
jgi:hypothetical protein